MSVQALSDASRVSYARSSTQSKTRTTRWTAKGPRKIAIWSCDTSSNRSSRCFNCAMAARIKSRVFRPSSMVNVEH